MNVRWQEGHSSSFCQTNTAVPYCTQTKTSQQAEQAGPLGAPCQAPGFAEEPEPWAEVTSGNAVHY